MSKQKAAKKPTEAPGSAEPAAVEVIADEGVRFMVSLSPAATRLLDTACLVEGKSRSAMLAGLVTEHLAVYFAGKSPRVDPNGAGGEL